MKMAFRDALTDPLHTGRKIATFGTNNPQDSSYSKNKHLVIQSRCSYHYFTHYLCTLQRLCQKVKAFLKASLHISSKVKSTRITRAIPVNAWTRKEQILHNCPSAAILLEVTILICTGYWRSPPF